MIEDGVLRNFVNGRWAESSTTSYQEVSNPATAEILARVPLSTRAKVDYAATMALAAFDDWRRTPAPARIQYLFKLKNLLEAQPRRPRTHDHRRERQDVWRSHR